MSEQIEVAKICKDGGTQSRSYINNQTVDEYAAAMRRGEEFPAITVIYDGQVYWLVDGYHRVAAAEKAKMEHITADVEQGTQADAQWASYGANPTHGLPRSSDDKRRAITAALKHPNGAEKSDREIAAHIRVDHKTVGTVRKQLIERGEIPQLEERIGADGKTYKVPVIQETMEGWTEKYVKPWANSFEGVDFVFIKCADDLYLSLTWKWSKELSDHYGLYADFTSLNNASGFERTVKLDQAFVSALVADGRTIQIVDADELDKPMKKVVQEASKGKNRNTFEPLTFAVNPGDLVMIGGRIYQVVEIGQAVLTVVSPGGKEKQLAQFKTVKPYQLNWETGKENELDYQQVNQFGSSNWVQRHTLLKTYYASNGILIYKVRNLMIALAEDADILTSTGLGLYCQTKHGAAYIIMMTKKSIKLDFDRPVITYTAYSDEKAEAWANGLINDAVRTSESPALPKSPSLEDKSSLRKGDWVKTPVGHVGQVEMYGGDRHIRVKTVNGVNTYFAENLVKIDPPTDSPVGKNDQHLALDVLAILYDLQAQHGGWVGQTLVNLNGTEVSLIEAQRVNRLQRRTPAGGLMTWYQITPAGCYDIGREALPVAPEPSAFEYPSADANADRGQIVFHLNEQLINVRDLLRQLAALDGDLHDQLYINYEVMRMNVLEAMGVQIEPERLS